MAHPENQDQCHEQAVQQRNANRGKAHCASVRAEDSSVCPSLYQIPAATPIARTAMIAEILRIAMTCPMTTDKLADLVIGSGNEMAVIFIPQFLNDEFCSQC